MLQVSKYVDSNIPKSSSSFVNFPYKVLPLRRRPVDKWCYVPKPIGFHICDRLHICVRFFFFFFLAFVTIRWVSDSKTVINGKQIMVCTKPNSRWVSQPEPQSHQRLRMVQSKHLDILRLQQQVFTFVTVFTFVAVWRPSNVKCHSQLCSYYLSRLNWRVDLLTSADSASLLRYNALVIEQ